MVISESVCQCTSFREIKLKFTKDQKVTVKVSAVDNMWMQVDNLLHELEVSGLAGLQQLIF